MFPNSFQLNDLSWTLREVAQELKEFTSERLPARPAKIAHKHASETLIACDNQEKLPDEALLTQIAYHLQKRIEDYERFGGLSMPERHYLRYLIKTLRNLNAAWRMRLNSAIAESPQNPCNT